MSKLRITRKLFAVIAFLIVITNAFFAVYNYKQFTALIEKQAFAEAKLLQDYFISMRNTYQRQFLSSGLDLNDSTVGFLPAHASTLISDEFSKRSKAGVTIRNVTDRPRNPKNKADTIEEEAMRYFASKPDQNERMITTVQDGKEIFFYAAPLRIESHCMQCHGKKEEVHPFIAKRYDTAYDYKIGDVRGVMSIKMSKDALAAELMGMLGKRMIALACLSLVFLILFWLALRRIISQEADAAEKERLLEYNTILEERVKEEIQKRLKQERTLLE
jgi:diguanylate cyclase